MLRLQVLDNGIDFGRTLGPVAFYDFGISQQVAVGLRLGCRQRASRHGGTANLDKLRRL
tara:strand:+ start:382 stop:558 length:177 start_codon:yes stop_codon:yes gene_type:complete